MGIEGDDFEALKTVVSAYLDAEQVALIERAYTVAANAHQDQKRHSGEPYISHPIAAALTLAKLQMDHQSIMAALLHDVLEDTKIDQETLIRLFGHEVTALVDGVSKLTQIEFENREQAKAENFRKMILAMVKDIRVILVKLADRLHNMRTLGSLVADKRRRIALETLEIYAPIANRLGMHTLCLELEDLGFIALYPYRYRVLQMAIQRAKANRAEVIQAIEIAIKNSLALHDLPLTVMIGRKKHFYSIYKKMRDKHLSFSEIMDIYGFRLITDSIDNCYRILGAVHGLYKPVPERFKDYIAIQKSNGYQSLHTTLFGPYGVPIEIQIRTTEMNHIAENGIAAHWLYKSKTTANTAQIKTHAWLKKLLNIQQNTGNSLEFIENVKIDLFPDEVYVFTPKGNILELPAGATPVDFAYSIHSDVGNTCYAAKINRRFMPLSTKLSNGQTVEIINLAEARPSAAWLNFVVTGKAKSNIRHFLKTQKRQESILFGQKMLDILFSAVNFSWETLPVEIHQKLLNFYHQKNKKSIFKAISSGKILAFDVFQKLIELLKHENMPSLMISGKEGNPVLFAPCCCPIPGDDIIGIIEQNKGLIVHTENCLLASKKRFKNTEKQTYLTLQWQNNTESKFLVSLTIEAINQRGLLAKLSTTITKADSDINHVQLHETQNGQYCQIHIIISVQNRVHLANIIRQLRHSRLITYIARKNINDQQQQQQNSY